MRRKRRRRRRTPRRPWSWRRRTASASPARSRRRSKAGGDMFDEMVAHEETIRLGEEGWKGRYYRARLPCFLRPAMNFFRVGLQV